MVSIKYNGFRWQQSLYLAVFSYTVATLVAAGFSNNFNDVNFTDLYLEQYQRLTRDLPFHLETNIALLIFIAILGLSDLFRANPVPVWFEMSWSLVFGLLEVGNLVRLGVDYPEAQCRGVSALDATSTLARREHPTSALPDGLIANTSANQGTILSHAASGVCGTWTAMFIFSTMTAIVTLLLVFGWWAIVGLRHRASHPDFFCDPTPTPLRWELEGGQTCHHRNDIETASVTSTAVSSSAFDEKKVSIDDLPSPVPVSPVVRVQISRMYSTTS